MKYVRTVSGGMIAITPKSKPLNEETKQAAKAKHQNNKLQIKDLSPEK